MTYLIELSRTARPGNIGQKARNLHWLLKNGCRVPYTLVIPSTALQDIDHNPEALRERLLPLFEHSIRPDQKYAVRSSANVEDGRQHSYAGQFCTFLDVQGTQALLAAVQSVRQAARSLPVHAYAQHSGQDLSSIQMAVIIQEMVAPVISGVSFSKNPLTGLDEVIIEALPGSGEQLVQEGKTPERWVYKWGKWIAQPENSALPPALMRQVAEQTAAAGRKYGAPVDMEWVFDGQELYWVQLRPITYLEQINIYSNRITREVFPGFIKPLVWTVNTPLVNTVWINLFREMIGPLDLKPEELAKQFGYRAYFNMGAIGRIFEQMGFPKESLELLMGLPGGDEKPHFKPTAKTIRLLPRLLAFALRMARIAPNVMPAVAQARRSFAAILSEPASGLDPAGLLRQVDRLYAAVQQIAYFNVVVPLLLGIYTALLRRQLARSGVDFAALNLTQGLDGFEEYDPNPHLNRLAQAYSRLDATPALAWSELDRWPEFQKEVAQFLEHFGHLSTSGNDFSVVPWRETPDLILQMIAAEAQRLREPSQNLPQLMTYSRPAQTPAPEDQGSKIPWESLKLSPTARGLLNPIYRQARLFRLYREAVSSTYTYGYGLFRIYFRAFGSLLAELGKLESADDIFFLRWDELRALAGDLAGAEVQDRVTSRKSELKDCLDVALPEIIYRDELPPLSAYQAVESTLKGIPSSRGYYRGPVKVIRDVAEFRKLNPGDVLVIPFSDVSWTPLFPRAGAVIAEAGGILSHSSIVAREYNLPCVVSVSHACQIPDNTLVTVDGYKGEVFVHGAE